MVAINKLKAKFVERGVNVGDVANGMGISKDALYRRIKGDGEAFTIAEVDMLAKYLELSKDELNEIFFAQIVA